MADETVMNGVADDQTVDIEDSGETNPKEAMLVEKVSVLEQEKLQLHHENEVIKERFSKLRQEIHDLESRNAKMKRDMDTAEADKKALESIAARAAQLETEVSRLQHDLITSMNEEDEMNRQLSELKGEFLELKKDMTEKDTRLDATLKERNLLLEKIVAIETAERDYTNELSLVEEDYKNRVNEKDSEIVALKNLLGKLENMVKDERMKLEKEKKERDELEIVKNELEGLLKKSERKVKEMESKVGGLEEELSASEKVISGLKYEENLNGKGLIVDGDVLEGRNKGLMSSSLQWPVVAGSVGAVAMVSVLGVLYLRYGRQK